MSEKCPDCPVAGKCIVQKSGHTPYCDWARAGGVWRARVAELSIGLPEDAPDAPRPTVDEAMRLVEAMRRCQWRSTDPGCGCSGSACGLRPKERRVVSFQDCIACIRAYGDP